jgi:ParB-like chromosome segregation protein Spo0J
MPSLKIPTLARALVAETNADAPPQIEHIPIDAIVENPFSIELYGKSFLEIGNLLPSIERDGILEPLIIVAEGRVYRLVSGHRRLACAVRLGFETVPCVRRRFDQRDDELRAILAHNRYRQKTFSQLMREADVLERLEQVAAKERRNQTLRQFRGGSECRESDTRQGSKVGRADQLVAKAVGLGGKDRFRQARAVWRAAEAGDVRALAGVEQLDAGSKTIFAAYKDLRRRDRFSAGFQPTPYDVWAFRSDSAFGVPHPGAIPPSIIAHLLHYFTAPGDLVIDPMAGGGSTIDVCEAMGRRCLAYDATPVRDDVRKHDVNKGFPSDCGGASLIFCDPPYHTMHARRYGDEPGVAELPLGKWLEFLNHLAIAAFQTLKSGGIFALLMANQTEKDLAPGFEYIDHAFFGYEAMRAAGFLPVRRISCPMTGAYLPQQVRRARVEGRLLGQVRDLLVMRKPYDPNSL